MVINPYYLPIIFDTMQQLEVFHYATALDINMVYYCRNNFCHMLTPGIEPIILALSLKAPDPYY